MHLHDEERLFMNRWNSTIGRVGDGSWWNRWYPVKGTEEPGRLDRGLVRQSVQLAAGSLVALKLKRAAGIRGPIRFHQIGDLSEGGR